MRLVIAGPPSGSTPSPSASAQGSWMSMLFLLLIFFVLFYFMAILPQRRKEKEFQRMINAMREGDTIVTIGGIVGRVIDIRKDTVKIKTANKTELEITKRSIASVLKPKEEQKEKEKEEG